MSEGGDAASDNVPCAQVSTDKTTIVLAPSSSTPVVQPNGVDDPLSPDAPLQHLLSISTNPLIENMSVEELTKLVQRCRAYATSQPTLSAKLATDAANVDPKKRAANSIKAKKAAILDEI